MRAPWGTDPDLGVTSSFLRKRADECETASEIAGCGRGREQLSADAYDANETRTASQFS